jgi:hypothetical protein
MTGGKAKVRIEAPGATFIPVSGVPSKEQERFFDWRRRAAEDEAGATGDS